MLADFVRRKAAPIGLLLYRDDLVGEFLPSIISFDVTVSVTMCNGDSMVVPP